MRLNISHKTPLQTHAQIMLISSEVTALNHLGLHDIALEEVQRTLETRTDESILYEAVCTALSNRSYELAAEYADRLALIPDLEKKDIQIISLAYNYAGRHQEAYLVCRDAVFCEGPSMVTDFYSLACRAVSIGRFEEALTHILKEFKNIQPGDGYLVRKAFIDSELVEAWEYASEYSPDLERALGVYFEGWQSILEENQCLGPERWVDHSDLKRIPSEFHILLKPRCPSTFLTTPLQAAKYPDLHHRYLEWQEATAAPHIAAFARYMENAEQELIQAQPLFAEFQAACGRFGPARGHLLCILRNSTDCDPSRLPYIPLLAPLLEEFQSQYHESPEAFRFLVGDATRCQSEEEFTKLPPINRSSGLAALYLGNTYYRCGRYADAISEWILCAKRWPWDQSATLNIIFGLLLEERYRDASRVLATVRAEALPDTSRRKIEENIVAHDASQNPCNQNPRIPTPEFEGFLLGANGEFLDWLERRKEPQVPAKKASTL